MKGFLPPPQPQFKTPYKTLVIEIICQRLEWILSFSPCRVNQSHYCSFCPVWESLASKFVLFTLDVFLPPTFNFLIMVFCFTATSLHIMKQDITLMIVMWLAVKCEWIDFKLGELSFLSGWINGSELSMFQWNPGFDEF